MMNFYSSLRCYLHNILLGNLYKDVFEWALISAFDISKLNYIKEAVVKN